MTVCDKVNPLMQKAYGADKSLKPSWLELYQWAVLLYITSLHYPVAAALVENMGGRKWRTRFEAVDPKNRMRGMGRCLFQEIERMVKEEEDRFPDHNMEAEEGEVPPEQNVTKLFAFVDKENMDTHGKFMKKLGFSPLSEDEVDDEEIECGDDEVAFLKKF